MGNDMSQSITPPPLSFLDCLIDGEIDIIRYMYYQRKRGDIILSKDAICGGLIKKRKSRNNFQSNQHKTKQNKRSVKRHKLLVCDNNGTLRDLKSTDTLWYLLYVKSPPRSERLARKFRTRFRMPHQNFITLSEDLEDHEIFNQWSCNDATGLASSNIKLLLLGSLRYIGRAWTFDDIEEANGISREINRVFLHCFLEYGSTILYKKWVLNPSLNANVNELEKLFRLAGFNGCIGSSDATHVGMLCCTSWAQILHKGFKLNIPSRTYNMTVDHTRKILGSTLGHPATWNDKTVILFDELVCKVRDRKIYKDFEFMLFERDKNNNIIEVPYKGVWFLVDNGYLDWSCTVPPIKHGLTYEEIRFSEWLESMRKDVECAFGILKGRFSILRYGIRLESISKCDQVWLTCCALHNMLLHIDGLDKNWENGVSSDWEIINECNKHKAKKLETSFAISRLNRKLDEILDQVAYDVQPKTTELRMESCDNFDEYTVNGKRVVAKMPLNVFQNCLVKHFDIRFKQNDIVWPRRIPKPQVI